MWFGHSNFEEKVNFFADEAPSGTSVYRYHDLGGSIQEEFHEERAISVVFSEAIDFNWCKLILQWFVPNGEVENTLGISDIFNIAWAFNCTKNCSHWLPHYLSNAQSKTGVVESWIYAYEPESKEQSTVRVLKVEPNLTKVAVFFKETVYCATIPLRSSRHLRPFILNPCTTLLNLCATISIHISTTLNPLTRFSVSKSPYWVL